MLDKISFIDLFAGVGGFNFALTANGGNCIFSSEIDENACKTYEKNHGYKPEGDITLPEIQEKIPQILISFVQVFLVSLFIKKIF